MDGVSFRFRAPGSRLWTDFRHFLLSSYGYPGCELVGDQRRRQHTRLREWRGAIFESGKNRRARSASLCLFTFAKGLPGLPRGDCRPARGPCGSRRAPAIAIGLPRCGKRLSRGRKSSSGYRRNAGTVPSLFLVATFCGGDRRLGERRPSGGTIDSGGRKAEEHGRHSHSR
jgi:hypothetical protein